MVSNASRAGAKNFSAISVDSLTFARKYGSHGLYGFFFGQPGAIAPSMTTAHQSRLKNSYLMVRPVLDCNQPSGFGLPPMSYSGSTSPSRVSTMPECWPRYARGYSPYSSAQSAPNSPSSN